jgi:hypothetical protein
MTSSALFNSPPTRREITMRWLVADRSGQDRWGEKWPPMGRTSGRQWGNPMAASGENYMATVTRLCNCFRRQTAKAGTRVVARQHSRRAAAPRRPRIAEVSSAHACRGHGSSAGIDRRRLSSSPPTEGPASEWLQVLRQLRRLCSTRRKRERRAHQMAASATVPRSPAFLHRGASYAETLQRVRAIDAESIQQHRCRIWWLEGEDLRDYLGSGDLEFPMTLGLVSLLQHFLCCGRHAEAIFFSDVSDSRLLRDGAHRQWGSIAARPQAQGAESFAIE